MMAGFLSFTQANVKAVVQERKTQTRRLLKPQPEWIESSGRWRWPLPRRVWRKGCSTDVVTASREWHEYAPPGSWPYAAGDLLWMKETWRVHRHHDPLTPSLVGVAMGGDYSGCIDYRASPRGEGFWGRWRSPRFMPRWASRLTLRVTDVRVQRVQEISEEDAIAEGVDRRQHSAPWIDGDPGTIHDVERRTFSRLWESIHGKGAWARNPWVVAISFKAIKKNIDEVAREHDAHS